MRLDPCEVICLFFLLFNTFYCSSHIFIIRVVICLNFLVLFLCKYFRTFSQYLINPHNCI